VYVCYKTSAIWVVFIRIYVLTGVWCVGTWWWDDGVDSVE